MCFPVNIVAFVTKNDLTIEILPRFYMFML